MKSKKCVRVYLCKNRHEASTIKDLNRIGELKA